MSKLADELTRLFNNEIKVDEAEKNIDEMYAKWRRSRWADWFRKSVSDPGDAIVGFLAASLILTLVAGLVLAVYAGFAATFASGQPDYCMVYAESGPQVLKEDGSKVQSTVFKIQAHRPWRSDVILGESKTLDDAVESTKKLGCPLRAR
jgi:hypothetical protein